MIKLKLRSLRHTTLCAAARQIGSIGRADGKSPYGAVAYRGETANIDIAADTEIISPRLAALISQDPEETQARPL